MLPILEDHLMLTETPAMQALYKEVTELFSQYDWEHTQNAYEDLLVSSPGLESGDADNLTLYNLTIGFTTQILREHGLELAEHCHLRDHVKFLKFIKAVETTEMVQECLVCIANEDMDNEEKFAQIVEYVTGDQIEDTIEMIPTVPYSVMRTLKEYFERRAQFMQQAETFDPAYVRVCNEMDLFARTIAGTEMQSYKHLFNDNGVIGMPFDFYWTRYKGYLLTLALQDLVYELIGFSLLSENGMDNPQKTIMQVIDQSFGNLETVTEIQNILTKSLIEYRNKVSSGVARTE